MTQPNEQTPPPAEPQAAPAQQPAATPQVFTADQVAERERVAAQKAHDAAFAEARRQFEGKQKPATSTTQQQPSQQSAPVTASQGMTPQDFLRISAFIAAAAAEHGIPARGVELLLERVMNEKPADVRAWTASEAASFGWSKPTTTATTTAPTSTTPPAAPATSAHPVTSTAAPADPARVTDDTPLLSLSEPDRMAFLQRKGVVEYTNRIRQEARSTGARISLRR